MEKETIKLISSHHRNNPEKAKKALATAFSPRKNSKSKTEVFEISKKILTKDLQYSYQHILTQKSLNHYIKGKRAQWKEPVSTLCTDDPYGNRIFYANYNKARLGTLIAFENENVLEKDSHYLQIYAENRALVNLIDYCISTEISHFNCNSKLYDSLKDVKNLKLLLRFDPCFLQSKICTEIIRKIPIIDPSVASAIGGALSSASQRGKSGKSNKHIHMQRIVTILYSLEPAIKNLSKSQLVDFLIANGYLKDDNGLKTLENFRTKIHSTLSQKK